MNPNLTCLPDPEDDAILKEPRTFDHNARAQGPQLFAASLSLDLATRTCEAWIMSPIYKLMNDSEHRHRTRSPRGYSIPVSALHKAMAYTPFPAQSLQTTQHTLGKKLRTKQAANNRVRTSDCEFRCAEA